MVNDLQMSSAKRALSGIRIHGARHMQPWPLDMLKFVDLSRNAYPCCSEQRCQVEWTRVCYDTKCTSLLFCFDKKQLKERAIVRDCNVAFSCAWVEFSVRRLGSQQKQLVHHPHVR